MTTTAFTRPATTAHRRPDAVMTGTARDREWLTLAVDLSRLSPPSPAHYAVGAVVTGHDGTLLASGYTGETHPAYHAEEAALAELAGRPGAATLYTSLEPCTTRQSRPHPCTDLILAAGIRRVVLALREPLLFADCHGVDTLRQAGVEVVEIGELAPAVREVNAHLLGRAPAAAAR
jgi:diaminohydroxyphosphoribosylaminopyrimidine deaminase / 5-amino-6-(5-phosphoribosylamino)uracil reductase